MKPTVFFPFSEEAKATFWNDATLERLRDSYQLVEPVSYDSPWESIPDSVEAIVIGWGGPSAVPARTWRSLKNLKAIANLGSSTAGIEEAADATRQGIAIITAADAVAEGVAEETIGLIIAAQYGLVTEAMCYRQSGKIVVDHAHRSRSVAGSTVGLVGFGFVGQQVAKRLGGFEVKLLVYDPYAKEEAISRHGARRVALDELLKTADIISVHAAWTPETEGMINQERLNMIRTGTLVVSTARMPLFDESALAEKIVKGELRFATDFVPFDASIWSEARISSCPDLIGVPGHTSMTTRTLDQMALLIADDLERVFSDSRPKNQVSAEWMAHTTCLSKKASK